jgi:Family of unknown function (DUF6585)
MTPQAAAGSVQLPHDVAALAVHSGMGPHLQTYQLKRLGVWRWLGFGVFIGGALVFAIAGAATGAWPAVLVGLLIAAPFVAIAYQFPEFNPSRARRRVYLFQSGFIFADGKGGLADYRWDAIAWVTQKIVERYVNGVHVGTNYLYTIARRDGRVLKLNQLVAGIAELGRQISQEVTRVKLPGAVALVQQGQTVGFGDLGIHAHGLVSSQGSVLPWREVEAVQVVQGQVKLRQAGKWLAWSSKPAAEIQNLYVFLTLADQLQRAAHGRAA